VICIPDRHLSLQSQTTGKPLNKIRFADKRPSKGDQIGLAGLNHRFGGLYRLTAIANQQTFKNLTEYS